MATTTNYGWTTPDDTDLVKMGASAIRTLGSAIDTSLNTALGTKKSGLVLLNTTTFSAQSIVSVNNVFTSSYTNYRIIIGTFSSSAAGSTTLRLRASGADNSTTNYKWVRAASTGASSSQAGSTTDTSFNIGPTGTTGNNLTTFELYSPQLAAATGMAAGPFVEHTATFYIGYSAGIFNATTQFDGFTLIPSSGNITGTFYVYGYNI